MTASVVQMQQGRCLAGGEVVIRGAYSEGVARGKEKSAGTYAKRISNWIS